MTPMPCRSCRSASASSSKPRGSTTIEQLLTLTVLAILATITIVGSGRLLDAAAVEAAMQEAAALFALAREHALATGMSTALRIDPGQHRLVVHTGADTLATAQFARSHIRLTSSRDSMAYAASGLGAGAANLRLVLSRGHRSDTLLVSRLGRVSRQ